MNRSLSHVLALALVFVGAGHARAELITLTVGGATFTAVGDTVSLTPRNFTIDLTPDGAAVIALLQAGDFIVGDSGQTNQTFTGTLSRSVTANGVPGTLSQPLTLSITPTADTLTIAAGQTLTLTLAADRFLDITPLGVSPLTRTTLGTTNFNVQASFQLRTTAAVVPEPSALVLCGVGIAALAGYRRWRKRAA